MTIRLDEDLDRLLIKASRQSGRSPSEIAREALRRQLRVSQFEALRKKIMPFAEVRGYHRLVCQVLDKEIVVKVIRMSSHYE